MLSGSLSRLLEANRLSTSVAASAWRKQTRERKDRSVTSFARTHPASERPSKTSSPVPPPAFMAPSPPVSTQTETVNGKITTSNKGARRKDKCGKDMHPTEEAADKMLLHESSIDSFDTNNGASNDEDGTALGLETMRKASLSTQKRPIKNHRKSSVPPTGRYATKTGSQGLKKGLPNPAEGNAHTSQAQRHEEDQETGASKHEASGMGGSHQETGSTRTALSRGVARVIATSKRLPAQLSSTGSLILRPSGAARPISTDADADIPKHAKPRFSQSSRINASIQAVTIFDEAIELSLNAPYIQEPNLRNLHCLSDEPIKNVLRYQKEALQAYYSENRFVCAFHNPLRKFLRQMPSEYLKCLKPGSVRLSSKLSHMGFVHRALQDLNARNADGLRSDVALVPITVDGEADDVWISWNHIDDYDGIRGGWAAGQGKVAKRRRHPARSSYECDEDELYT
ncbi:hypothetical protein BST61_g11369 [Cercospora zeina]